MQSTKKCLFILFFIFISNNVSSQHLSKSEAFEDFEEFKELMNTESSYYQLSNYDFTKSYEDIKQNIDAGDSIPIYFLAYEFEKLIAETIDRHASVRMDRFEEVAVEGGYKK